MLAKRPYVWKERILIVDDEPAITELLSLILDDVAVTDIAHNGEEGLRKLEGAYYSVIISDIDMPVMNGMDFFEQAVKRFPEGRDNFLFYTGDVTVEFKQFIKKNNVKYMVKPSPIIEVKNTISELMHRSSDQ